MNKYAQALGRLAKGIPKNYSPEERKRRSDWMKSLNKRGRQNVDIMDATDTCVTCFSISVLEKKVKKLEDIVIANPLFKKE